MFAEGYDFLGKFDSAALFYEKVYLQTPLSWADWKEGNRFKAIECYNKSKQYNKVLELSKGISDSLFSLKKAMRKGNIYGELRLLSLSLVKNILSNFIALRDTEPVLYIKYYDNAKYTNTDVIIFTANAYFETGQDSLGTLYTEYSDDRFTFNSKNTLLLDSLTAMKDRKSVV